MKLKSGRVLFFTMTSFNVISSDIYIYIVFIFFNNLYFVWIILQGMKFEDLYILLALLTIVSLGIFNHHHHNLVQASNTMGPDSPYHRRIRGRGISPTLVGAGKHLNSNDPFCQNILWNIFCPLFYKTLDPPLSLTI